MSSDAVAHNSVDGDHHNVDEEAYEPTYAEAFPPLPISATPSAGESAGGAAPAQPQWNKLSMKTSIVTQVIK